MFLRVRIRCLHALLVALLALTGCSSRTQPVVGESTVANPSLGNVLTAADIEARQSATSFEDILQMIPGVIVRRGAPGVGSVQISGRGGPPLFVINGVPQSNVGAALGLNPRDIARIEVIKDGAASSHYGFRGANGIILVTTKR